MEGVSHPTFRDLVAARGGVGVVCTEFVRITGTPVSLRFMEQQVRKSPGVPLSVQVMGTHVEHMAEAAEMIAQAGADIVDINLGCPAPRVVKKGAGSAMLKDPELLFEVLSSMRERVPGVLSAKIRAGFDDASNVVRIAQTVQRAGADFIAVHPRRRADFYDGVSDWRIIKLLKESLDIPVVGNGDVWYAGDASRMMEETGCDAVMIGRPALRNPWIFEQIQALAEGRPVRHPSGRDVAEHLQEVVTHYEIAYPKGPRRKGPVGKIKELVTYLGRAIDDGGAWRGAALRCRELEPLMACTWEALEGLPPERVDMDAAGTLGLERSGSAVAHQSESLTA